MSEQVRTRCEHHMVYSRPVGQPSLSQPYLTRTASGDIVECAVTCKRQCAACDAVEIEVLWFKMEFELKAERPPTIAQSVKSLWNAVKRGWL